MRYSEHKPCSALAQHLECIWFVVDDEDSLTRAPEKILPDGCFEWIFHLGTPFQRRLSDDRWETQPRSFFVGELTRFLLLQSGRHLATMGVRFRPASAYRFLPLSMHVVTDDTVATADVWGAEGAELETRVLEAKSDDERKQIVETFLIRRLQNAETRPRFETAVTNILHHRGQLRMDHLAARVGWSPRQLEREFRAGLGVPPKAFARIIRFQNLLRLVGENTLHEWAMLALAVGYADQPHMVREFREFAGQSPTQTNPAAFGDLSRNFVSPQRLAMLLGEDDRRNQA